MLQEEFIDIHDNKAHTTIEYDAAAKQWKRTVTDPFRTYHSTGTFATDGTIAFYETPTDRESYRPIDHDHVRFFGEKSTDAARHGRCSSTRPTRGAPETRSRGGQFQSCKSC